MGARPAPGQLVRLLDIPADRGLGFGAFDHAGEYGDAGKLADAIKDAAGSAFGTAGPEFVRNLMTAPREYVAGAQKVHGVNLSVAWPSRVHPSRSSARRRSSRWSPPPASWRRLVASRHGRAGMPSGRRAWLSTAGSTKRGGAGSHEERQAVEQVRLVIEQHGVAIRARRRFLLTSEVRDRLGWCKGEGAGSGNGMCRRKSGRPSSVSALIPPSSPSTLAARGMLRRQDRGHLQCVVALNGKSKTSCYVLTATILDGGEG